MQYMSLWIKATAKYVYYKINFVIFSHLYQMIQSFSHIVMLYNEAERWRLVYMYVCVCVCMYLFVKAKLIKGRQACVVKLWSQLGHGTAISQQIVCVRSHFFFQKWIR